MTGLLIERYGYLPAGWVALTCALTGTALLGLVGSGEAARPAARRSGDPGGDEESQARPSRR